MTKDKTHLLNPADDQVLIVQPTVAALVGLNEAVFLQRLNYLISLPDMGREIDGRRWVYNTLYQWIEHSFPFWDIGVLKRTINNLEADGLVLSSTRHNTMNIDRTKWYTIDRDRLAQLLARGEPVERLQNKRSTRTNAAARRTGRGPVTIRKEQNVLIGERDEIGPKEQNVLIGDSPKEQNVLIGGDLDQVLTINPSLPPHPHRDLFGKEIYYRDRKGELHKAVCNKVNDKTVGATILGTGEIRPRLSVDNIFYQNGGAGLSPVGLSDDTVPKLTEPELKMKGRLLTLVDIKNEMTKVERIRLAKWAQEAAVFMVARGDTIADVDQFERWYKSDHWRGRDGESLTPKLVSNLWKDWKNSTTRAQADQGQVAELAKVSQEIRNMNDDFTPEAHEILWADITQSLRGSMMPGAYNAHFAQARPVSFVDDVLVVEVSPNALTWINGRLKTIVDRAINSTYPEIGVEFVTAEPEGVAT